MGFAAETLQEFMSVLHHDDIVKDKQKCAIETGFANQTDSLIEHDNYYNSSPLVQKQQYAITRPNHLSNLICLI